MAVENGDAEPLVDIEGRSIDYSFVNPDKVDKADYPWDKDLYKRGCVFVNGLAVELTTKKVEEKSEIDIRPSEQYRTFMKSEAIEQMAGDNLKDLITKVGYAAGMAAFMSAGAILAVVQYAG